MQYILTQSEFDALRDERQKRTRAETKELQAFCTLAAQSIPIVAEWWTDKTPRPWGCILGPRNQSPGYCDRCPAQVACPHEGKEYSK